MIEKLRIKMAEKFNEFENYFVIDSMPLEVCKMARSSRSKICKEVDYFLSSILTNGRSVGPVYT